MSTLAPPLAPDLARRSARSVRVLDDYSASLLEMARQGGGDPIQLGPRWPHGRELSLNARSRSIGQPDLVAYNQHGYVGWVQQCGSQEYRHHWWQILKGKPLHDESVVGVEGVELARGRDAGGQRDQEVQAELVVALAIEGEETFDDPQQTPDTGPGAELFVDLACQRFSAGLQHFDAPAGQQPVVGAGNALQQHAAGAIGDPRDTEAEAGIADVVDDHIPRIAARSVRWGQRCFAVAEPDRIDQD